MTRNKKRDLFGHVIRWCVIAIMLMFLIRIMSSPVPWSFEYAVKQNTQMLEVPEAQILSVLEDKQGVRSVVLLDQENQMYHHFFAEKKYELLWINRGGSYAMNLDGDTILHFRFGMSTLGDYRYYYYTDVVRDANIASIHITWQDGTEEEAAIEEGIAHAVHAISIRDEEKGIASQAAQLVAYDADGAILYELSTDYEHSRVPKPEA